MASLITSLWGSYLAATTPLFRHTVGTFVIHEVFYWGTYLPFLLAARIPALDRYRLQPDAPPPPSVKSNCVRKVLTTHALLVAPIIVATHPLLQAVGAGDGLPLPSAVEVATQVALCFLLEDFFFYWGHRALHTRTLYAAVHRVHHEHAAPFGAAAEYAHPAEVLFLGASTIVGPALMGPHLLTLYVYLALRCMQTVECHSGYEFPWSLNVWVPWYGGAEYHDWHHKTYFGNYASTFTWWDAVYGTDAAYRADAIKRKCARIMG